MDNIVNWGLAASAWAPITVDNNGDDTYGLPRLFAGNRQINFSPAGDMSNVYADGTIVYTGKNNSGYTGTIESTNLEEEFIRYALGEIKTANNLQYEPAEAQVNRFALLWEWVGDQRRARHCMFNVTANRNDLNATTKGDGGTKTAQYQTLNLIAIPRHQDEAVKIRTLSDTSAAVYNGWFNGVPTISGENTQLVTITVKKDTANVVGAVVMLSDGTMGYTDSSGIVYFHKEAGTYDVFVSKSGNTAAVDSITVASAAVDKTITMS